MEAGLLISASSYIRVREDEKVAYPSRGGLAQAAERMEKGRRGEEECLTPKKVGEKVANCVSSRLFLMQKTNKHVTRKFSKGETCGMCSRCSQGSGSSIAAAASNSRLALRPLWSLSRGGVVLPALFSQI